VRARLIAALCAILITIGLHGQELIFKSGFEPPPSVTFVSGSGSDQIALPLTSLTDPLVVRVVDDFEDPVPGHGVSYLVTSGAGSLTAVDTVTDANGEANASWTLGPQMGPQETHVYAQGVTDPVIFQATADYVEVTTDQMAQAMEIDPPQNSAAPPISGTAWTLHELTLLAMYEKELLQVRDNPDLTIESLYAQRMAHMVTEFQQPVTDGIRIWMMYNHGFVIKSPTGSFAFDLRDGAPFPLPWNYELPQSLLDQIDILFISHEHDDHWQARVADAILAAGGNVVYPDVAGTQYDLTAHGNVPMAPDDNLTLSGFNITAHYGEHSAPNRIYEVATPEGIRVMHTGDTQGSQWIPEAGTEPVDVMLPNCWIDGLGVKAFSPHGLINAINQAQPKLMIPGHYARFYGNRTNLHLGGYRRALAVPAGLPAESETDVQILLWGERFDYVPGLPLPVSVMTTLLRPAIPDESYSEHLAARGGDGVYSWSLVDGTLPPGLSLAVNGEISGTATLEGTWDFIVEVKDGEGDTDRAALSIRVRTPLILQPSELCAGYPEEAIATFEDPDLKSTVREALGLTAVEDLTCGLVTGLRELSAESDAGIESLTGIQNLTSLKSFAAHYDDISDLSPLAGLTRLEWLSLRENAISDISPFAEIGTLTFIVLSDNSVTDISAMSGLTNLWRVYLSGNTNLSDIQPLLDNPGFVGPGDWVYLENTNVSCADVALLEAKGVAVYHTCL